MLCLLVVSKSASVTKMGPDNIALVFGPNLLRFSANPTPSDTMKVLFFFFVFFCFFLFFVFFCYQFIFELFFFTFVIPSFFIAYFLKLKSFTI